MTSKQSSSPHARGACPTLAKPMAVADGLLVRFRPVAEGFTPDQLEALANSASKYGNGLIEVTARGNVQVRGLTAATEQNFRMALDAAGIEAQTGVSIEISPIAGLDPKAVRDPRPLARAVRQVCDATLEKGPLSPKLSIVIVSGGQLLLDGLKADIRLIARHDCWILEVGGETIGSLAEAQAAEAVGLILAMLQDEGPSSRGMDLQLGRIRAQLPFVDARPLTLTRPASYVLGPISLTDGGVALRIGLPFGQVKSAQLLALARSMRQYGVVDARPAPDRTLALTGFDSSAMQALSPALAAHGFWTRQDVGASRLTLCSGAEKSEIGIIQAAELAMALFAVAPDLIDGSFHIHVSTCAKGCPHAGRPGIMLCGNALTHYRGATQKPFASLDPGAMEASIVDLAARIRETRRPEDSTLESLDRLGHE